MDLIFVININIAIGIIFSKIWYFSINYRFVYESGRNEIYFVFLVNYDIVSLLSIYCFVKS